MSTTEPVRELEAKIFEILTHGYPAPFAKVDELAKKISALSHAQAEPVSVVSAELATRLSEYKNNPHHINPISGRFGALLDDILEHLRSPALSHVQAPVEVVALKKRIGELEQIAGERYIDLNLLYQKLEDAGIDIDALQAPAETVPTDGWQREAEAQAVALNERAGINFEDYQEFTADLENTLIEFAEWTHRKTQAAQQIDEDMVERAADCILGGSVFNREERLSMARAALQAAIGGGKP